MSRFNGFLVWRDKNQICLMPFFTWKPISLFITSLVQPVVTLVPCTRLWPCCEGDLLWLKASHMCMWPLILVSSLLENATVLFTGASWSQRNTLVSRYKHQEWKLSLDLVKKTAAGCMLVTSYGKTQSLSRESCHIL